MLRNTVAMMGGQLVKLSLQAVYFILIARCLGSREYGAFVTVSAAVAVLGPFCALGTPYLLIKHVARDRRQFPVWWGTTLVVTTSSGIVAVIGLLAAGHLLFPSTLPVELIGLISISDLVFAKYTEASTKAFQATERLGRTALLDVLAAALRAIAAFLLPLLWARPTAELWAYLYFACSSATGMFAVVVATIELGLPRFDMRGVAGELREGFYFAANLSARSVYNDIDKTMLGRLATLDAAGIYAAAYRVVDVAFSPITALLAAAYPVFFRHGARGLDASYAFAKRLLRPALLTALMITVALVCGAPLLPHVLGRNYARSATALLFLAPLPVLKTLHYFVADALTGAGYQGTRTAVQVTIAVVNVLLNLWFIPSWGWRGAAWASLLCDGALAGALWLTLLTLRLRASGARGPDAARTRVSVAQALESTFAARPSAGE